MNLSNGGSTRSWNQTDYKLSVFDFVAFNFPLFLSPIWLSFILSKSHVTTCEYTIEKNPTSLFILFWTVNPWLLSSCHWIMNLCWNVGSICDLSGDQILIMIVMIMHIIMEKNAIFVMEYENQTHVIGDWDDKLQQH